MTRICSDRKPLAMGAGVALTLGMAFAPWAMAGSATSEAVGETPPGDAPVMLHAAPATGAVLLAHAEVRLPPRLRWEPSSEGTRVYLDENELFTLVGDDGVKAARLSYRLNLLHRQGALRSDRVTPGRKGDRYVVRVGPMEVLEIDEGFAFRQGEAASTLTLSYVNALREALGGLPIQVQASRGMLPGSRSDEGQASWYGGRFHGRRTANGERFDMHAQTAAHRTLPFGTLLLVTNLSNGKATLVRVTDRGPYAHGRSLDVSWAAAEALGMVHSGVARVRYTILE